MDNNETPQPLQPVPGPLATNETTSINGQVVQPPDSAVSPTKKSGKKFLTILLILLLVAASAGAAYYLLKPETKPKQQDPSTGKAATTTLASAKPQYSMGKSVAGYIKFDSTKFKEVDLKTMPEVKAPDADVNSIIVEANAVSWGDAGLYLYDLTSNKMYKLTSGGGDPKIMSDHFLAYGFDENVNGTKQLGAKLLNLQTGETQTIYSGNADETPATLCCSVSPDGFKIAFAQKDKIGVWDIRTATTKDYKVSLNPIELGFKRSSPTDYTVEISYATPIWANNDTLVYADKTAVSAGDGKSAKPVVDTNLYSLALADGKSTEIPTGNGGIYNVYAEGGTLFADEELPGATTTQISIVAVGSQPKLVTQNPGFVSVSPAGDKVYTFPGLGVNTNQVDVKTGTATPTNMVPSGTTPSQILPKGWASKDRMILQVLDTAGKVNHEYIAIYDTTTNTVIQTATVK